MDVKFTSGKKKKEVLQQLQWLTSSNETTEVNNAFGSRRWFLMVQDRSTFFPVTRFEFIAKMSIFHLCYKLLSRCAYPYEGMALLILSFLHSY